MERGKKKVFSNIGEAFKLYIPDYVPPDLRKPIEEIGEEKQIGTEFAVNLVRRFKENIRLGSRNHK